MPKEVPEKVKNTAAYLDEALSGLTLEEAKAFARLFEKRALAMEDLALKLDLHAFDQEVAELDDD